MKETSLEQMNVAVVGHVDHGKSTLVGRVLADTGSLPDGKLEQVRAMCARNARPFEYAFLLDALKDEQAQGITIDTARCFFKTARRRYIIIDAPGHIEFLKNMISGAARAEAVFIVIDAHEGIRENSKRHGYMVSMLGIRQVAVAVNKMDLVNYSEDHFNRIRDDYTAFLGRFDLKPVAVIPVAALTGENIQARSTSMPWYKGPTVLDQFDAFNRIETRAALPFRMPVQDIYKFTESGDERRIVAGTIETGRIQAGEEVVFHPSGKRSRIQSVERFSALATPEAAAGEAPGFTLDTQLYIRPGELMVKASDPAPLTGTRFRASLFWMGKAPMRPEKRYAIKIGAARTPLKLARVLNVLDASDLTSEANKQQIDRHDVAECILETHRPVAFDLAGHIPYTGRFVVIDNYEIAGAGVVLERIETGESTLSEHVKGREFGWSAGTVDAAQRAALFGHSAKFVVITGEVASAEALAQEIERSLIGQRFNAYYLRMANVVKGLDADLADPREFRDEHIRRLGELARILTDAGTIFITSLSEADDVDVRTLELLNRPHEILVVAVGTTSIEPARIDLSLPPEATRIPASVEAVCALLRRKNVILDYQI